MTIDAQYQAMEAADDCCELAITKFSNGDCLRDVLAALQCQKTVIVYLAHLEYAKAWQMAGALARRCDRAGAQIFWVGEQTYLLVPAAVVVRSDKVVQFSRLNPARRAASPPPDPLEDWEVMAC
ncbi:MAG: hypothetical protein HC890_20470 [Chloroflexaceae bacterium]|nr:hypothetical protein [Chloroflexaceae bacterium]